MCGHSRCLLLCCVVVASIAASAPAQTSRPTGMTQHDDIRSELAFQRRTLVGAYEKEGRPKDDTDKAARDLLERYAVYVTNLMFDDRYRLPGDAETSSLEPLVKKLGKCESPIVQYVRGKSMEDDYYREFKENICRYGPQLIAGDYPAFRKYQAARALAWLTPDELDVVRRMVDQILPTVQEANGPAERRLVYHTLTSQVWTYDTDKKLTGLTTEERDAILKTLDASPKADPWLVNMLRGENEVDAAYELHGGSADKDAHGKHLASARAALTAAYRLDPALPEAAARMITVCKCESNRDEARVWFDRAIAAQIDYEQAWRFYRGVLQPSEGGSYEAMERLADEAVKTRRFDTLAPMFAKTIFEDMGEGAFRRPGVWDTMNAIVDGYTEPPQRGVDVRFMKSRRAAYAYWCGQYAEAVKIIDGIGPDFDPKAASETLNTTPTDLRAECAAMSGLRVSTYRKLTAMEDADRREAAHDAYASLLSQLPADDPDRPYVLQRERATSLAVDFAAGTTAPVPTGIVEDLAAWTGDTAAWSISDGVLACTTDAKLSIRHRAVMPKDFTATLDWQWSAAAPGAAPPRFGVAVIETEEKGRVVADFRPWSNRIVMEMDNKFELVQRDRKTTPFDLSADVWHALQLSRTGSAITLTLDGVKVMAGVEDSWFKDGKSMLGLVVKPNKGKVTVRVRDITVRPIAP